MSNLNKQQLEAITLNGKNALVLAGAGSGKTTTIIERIAYLIENNVNPQRILVLTFTRRAANELIERLSAKNQQNHGYIRAGTFHRFCLNIIKSHPHVFNDGGKLLVIDRDDQISLINRCRSELLNTHEDREKKILSNILPKPRALLELLSYARNKNMELGQYLKTYFKLQDEGDDEVEQGIKMQMIMDILTSYNQNKASRGYMDYDDLLIQLLNMMRDNEAFRNKIKASFDFILVDEIQDTNVIQWLILEQLSKPALLYCVGDDAQNIYGFRGATPENTRHFLNRVENSVKLKLTINYRSTQAILNLANYVIKQSKLDYDKELETVRGQGDLPIIKDFLQQERAAQWIAEDILKKQKNGVELKDIMIMARTAWHAKPVEALLIEMKVKYRFIGGDSLLKAAHVKDLLAICRAALNKDDDLSWNRVLTMHPGVGEKTAINIGLMVKACQSNEEIAALFLKKAKQFPLLPSFLNAVWQNINAPAALLTSVIEAAEDFLKANYQNWNRRRLDYELLVRLSERFDSISSFINSYTIDPQTASDAAVEDDDAVKLITIHSAKGLEAKHCYLIEAQRGSFPYYRATDRAEIEEERRVLYVAITRAKDQLVITRSLSAPSFGESAVDFIGPLIHLRNLVEYEKPSLFNIHSAAYTAKNF